MKKVSLFLIAAIITACFVGCANENVNNSGNGSGSAGSGGGTNVIRTDASGKIGKYEKPYEVGDIVFYDGSATPYTSGMTLTNAQKSAAIALIFYKGTGLNSDDPQGNPDTTTTRTLGVGLKHTTLPWCINAAGNIKDITTIRCPESENNGVLTFTGDKNGSDNLEQISAFLTAAGVTDDTANEEKYPAFHYAKNYKNETGSNVSGTYYENGWYVPSIAELFQIYVNGIGPKKVFDINAASLALGGSKFLYSDAYSDYWSSSQLTSDSPDSYDYACRFTFKQCYVRVGSKGGNNSVCCIRDFSSETDGTDLGEGRTVVSGKIGKYEKPYEVGDIVFYDGSAMPYRAVRTLTDTQKSAAIALIFYKGTGLNSDDSNGNPDTTTSRTLGVGLRYNTTSLEWCIESASANGEYITTIVCEEDNSSGSIIFTGDKNGSNNLEQISAFLTAAGVTDDTTNEEKYPAFYYAKNYKNVTGSNVSGTNYEDGWYLPSIAELLMLQRNGKGKKKLFDIDIVCEYLGVDKFKYSFYWSSSEYPPTENEMMSFAGSWGYCLEFNSENENCGNLNKDYVTNTNICVCCIREFN